MARTKPRETPLDPFLEAFRGSFSGVLRWPQLDALWDRIRARPEGWYIYAVGEAPPTAPADPDKLEAFIREVDALLRREHEEDYCGIVYTDSFETPAFVKIFDPNNLGVSCGFSDNPPLPGWILSRIPPVDLPNSPIVPGNRKRWWQRIFG
ncbi:MAG: hypothetical protein D6721_02515 [Gammaproteobacteria bacterium]|nr:MAG: hypothetical protein D6721_02515 [Gammaproteobacteria bacterium]